jgi:hypothetical protein
MAAVSAVKTAAVKPTAVKTSANFVGLGSTNANRCERDGNDRNSHQELAGHVTLLFTFRIRLRHWIGMQAPGWPVLQKEMPGLLKYRAAFAGLEPNETSPLLLSLYRFLAFRRSAGARHNQVIRVHGDGVLSALAPAGL